MLPIGFKVTPYGAVLIPLIIDNDKSVSNSMNPKWIIFSTVLSSWIGINGNRIAASKYFLPIFIQL
ncbi:hypothetical protein MK805_12455 [Shimazuella sp. AN120528]|uniref:hypothetical protein n=1 Tax=Shimazuella soli TaxID=1892854 RepID=UPI001F10C03D|nr:hypothetical protein [Shimazuella soli]MCH5585755.1 hypothetical protein [Shimazuella soli]